MVCKSQVRGRAALDDIEGLLHVERKLRTRLLRLRRTDFLSGEDSVEECSH